eukprot:6440761-Lingulodinium_polyedra.AAC.1
MRTRSASGRFTDWGHRSSGVADTSRLAGTPAMMIPGCGELAYISELFARSGVARGVGFATCGKPEPGS